MCGNSVVALFHPIGNFLIIIPGSPYVTEEIGGFDISVFGKEIPVAAAAEHDIGIEFATEFATGFGKDTGKVGDFPEFFPESREIVTGDGFFTDDPALFDEEIVAACCCNQKGGGWGWLAFIDVVFDEIEKLAGFVADAFDEAKFLWGVVRVVIEVARLIGVGAAGEEFHECIVPRHDGSLMRDYRLVNRSKHICPYIRGKMR